MNYTGTILPDIDIVMPVFGTIEGRGLRPSQRGPQRGVNLAPLLEFPYASPEVHITDAFIDQRYWRALWLDVAFDAKPAQGTSPSRLYQAHIRYYDFILGDRYRRKDRRRPMMVKEVKITLKTPVAPQGSIFPIFTRVKPGSVYAFSSPRGEERGKLQKGFIDLPPGGYAGDLIVLDGSLRAGSDGSVGFPGSRQMDRSASRRLDLVGKLPQSPRPARYRKPPVHNGTHRQATLRAPALWRQDNSLDYFGVFGGKGLARLDVTKPDRFFAGNIITASDPRLRLSVIRWEKDRIIVEANNPTDKGITARLSTPREITTRFHLEAEVLIPASTLLRLHFPK